MIDVCPHMNHVEKCALTQTVEF